VFRNICTPLSERAGRERGGIIMDLKA